MFFGPKSFQNPKRELPRSVKMQICTQLVLLAIVCGLFFIVVQKLRQSDQSPVVNKGQDVPAEVTTADAGDPPDDSPVPEAELIEVLEPQLPEPYVHRSEVRFLAAAKDRTAELCEDAIVHYFHKIRAQELSDAKETPAPVLSARRGDAVWRQLMSNPEGYREKLVEIRGNVVSQSRGERPLQLKGLPYPNPSGVDRGFLSYVYDDHDKFFIVYTLKKQDLQHLDGVLLKGHFLQLYTNQIDYNGRLIPGTVPFLVGSGYELLPSPVKTSYDIRPLLPYAIVLPVIAAVIIAWVSFRSQRNYEARRAAAKKKAKG